MFKTVGIRNPVHKYKQCVFTVQRRCSVHFTYVLHNLSVSSAASASIPATRLYNDRAMNLRLFYCLCPLASIVSMFSHSMLECVRFRLVTLDIEGPGRFFRRNLARFLW